METTSQKAQIGVVGMGVMGENLARNAEEKGFQVAVYNRTPDAVDKVMAKAKAQGATRIQLQLWRRVSPLLEQSGCLRCRRARSR